MDILYVILTILLVDISLNFHLYMIHNLPFLQPYVTGIFQYEIDHGCFVIRSYLCYITFPDDENVLDCIVSSGHFCRIDTALHQVNRIQEYSYFFFKDNKEKISRYCQISILNISRDQAISIDKDSRTITIWNPIKLCITCLISITCLTKSCPLNL